MAAAAKRATTKTTLILGQVKAEIGLFATSDKPQGVATFDTAGPKGGILTFEANAEAKPLSNDQPMPDLSDGQKGDPLGGDPGPEAPPLTEPTSGPSRPSAPVEGQYTRKLVEKDTGEIVEPEQVRKGIRHEDGTFTDLTDHLKNIEEITKLEKMEIVDFIDVGVIDRARIVGSYYIGAQEAQDAKTLRLIYEAMKLKRRVAVVKWTAKSRQSLGVLTAHGTDKTLMLLKLVWAEDFREAPAKALSVANAAVSPEEIDMAARLVEAMSGKAADSLDVLRDDAIVLRTDLRRDAEEGKVLADIAPAPAVEEMSAEQAFEESIAAISVGKG